MLDKRNRRSLSAFERRAAQKAARSRSGKPKSLWERVKSFFLSIWWWWTGGLLSVKLADPSSKPRTEAKIAVDRVVFETNIAPDCVSAIIERGGCAIKVTHDAATEVFIHKTYGQAADKAIEWLLAQGSEVSTDKKTSMSRKALKVFDAQRRKLMSAIRQKKRDKDGWH